MRGIAWFHRIRAVVVHGMRLRGRPRGSHGAKITRPVGPANVFRAGWKSPPAVGPSGRARERFRFWRKVSRSGRNPEPTVTVRMKEDGHARIFRAQPRALGRSRLLFAENVS